MYEKIIDLLTAFLAMEDLVANETMTFVRNVWNENKDKAKDLAKKIRIHLVLALFFTITSFLIIIFDGSGVITGFSLGIAIAFLIWAGAMIGFAWITLKWAYLAVLLGKSVLIDAHGIGLQNVWKILKSTGSWASDKAATIIKLAAAAIPGVNLAEVQNAFAKGFPTTSLDPMFESTKAAINNIMAEAERYGAAIKSGWITWMSVLAILFIVNIIGFPKFLNNAANLSLALFLVVVTIYSAINPPPKRTGFHHLWMVVCILVLGVLIYRAVTYQQKTASETRSTTYQTSATTNRNEQISPKAEVFVPAGERWYVKASMKRKFFIDTRTNNPKVKFLDGDGQWKLGTNPFTIIAHPTTQYFTFAENVWIKEL